MVFNKRNITMMLLHFKVIYNVSARAAIGSGARRNARTQLCNKG